MPLSVMDEKIVDAIREGEIVTITEREARDDNLFILREHHEAPEVLISAMPLPEWRVRRAAHHAKLELPARVLPKWQSYLPEYKKNNVLKELIDNFQWEIAKARRAKNLSRLQLANVLGVPEQHIKMLENGDLPSDDFVLLTKLQNYLGINLRKDGKSFQGKVQE